MTAPALLSDDIKNASSPTPGMGLVLDVNGTLPQSVLQRLPGYEFAYAEITATVTVSSSVAASPTSVVSAPAVNFDGSTTVLVQFFTPAVYLGAGANSLVSLDLWDGSTRLGQIAGPDDVVDGNIQFPVFAARRLTPTAGVHTYAIKGYRNVINGTVVAGTGAAGTFDPAFIRITRV